MWKSPAKLAARLAALALLLWPASTLWQQTGLASKGRESHPGLYPNSWILGGPQVEPLRRFLGRAEKVLPEDARVVVASEHYDASQFHYLEMWVAYYLPRQRVTMRQDLERDGEVFRLFYPGREPPEPELLVLRDERTSLERAAAP